ncbi:pilus assembly protein [Thalassolituus oleivorans]|uniref:pilus assembly protein n=1 Tax=Thalassolituus oleivorans TaxID=187493 RepID=UPI0023EF6979|nr:PilC/PilY family type IV pilus protein [Thalassolituus oleivorans]
MKCRFKVNYIIRALLPASLLSLLLTASLISVKAHADDIDIYAVNSSQNMLLLFDTSLSMAKLEYFDPGEYDPNFIYPKSNNGYDPESIYVGMDKILGLIPLADGSSDTEINSIKRYRLNRDNVYCAKVLDAIDQQGVFRSESLSLSDQLLAFINFFSSKPGDALRLWDPTTKQWTGVSLTKEIINLLFGAVDTILGSEISGILNADPTPGAILDCRDMSGSRTYGSTTYSSPKFDQGGNTPYKSSGSSDISTYQWNNSHFNAAWSGNYLNYEIAKRQFLFFPANYASSRLGIARSALLNALKNHQTSTDLKVGLMRFDINLNSSWEDRNAQGGFVDVPLDTAASNYEYLKNKLLRYHPDDNSPLSETMFEAYRYISNGPVKYGASSNVYWLGEEEPINTWFGSTPNNFDLIDNLGSLWGVNAGHEVSAKSVKVKGADYHQTLTTGPGGFSRGHDRYYDDDTYYASGENYIAPDLGECGSTQLVIFTDGMPTDDTDANSDIQSLIATSGVTLNNDMSASCSGNGGCAEELAYVMANADLNPSADKILNIQTHVVGGFLKSGWLEESATTTRSKLQAIADAGNGQFYSADSYEELENVFNDIFNGFTGKTTTFSSPGLSLSSTNRLQLTDELYFSLFKPEPNQSWAGNLKRYRINDDGEIVDINENAVFDDNGDFIATSQSFWSDAADGSNVTLGGIVNKLDMGSRKIFTTDYSATNAVSDISATISLTPVTLLSSLINSATSLLSNTVLGLSASDPGYEELVAWIGGINADGSARLAMEDPLHSSPVMINYGDKRVVFVATNSGYIHAFNPDLTSSSNAEYFSFIPTELLRNPRYYLNGQSFFSNKRYGMDGPLSYFHNDENRDGKVNNGETVLLYATMRRGGQSLYALDISDLTSPKLAWQVNGDYSLLDWDDINVPTLTTGFDLLGQTWSAMRPVKIKWNGSTRYVIFVGGGYDPLEDGVDSEGPATRTAHDVGTTIYMLDAFSGVPMWSAATDADLSGSEQLSFTSAFATDVVPIDRDNNSFVDLIYATDIGGRVWRFDLEEENTSKSDFATAGVIADINMNSSGITIANRRFYNRPDVSIIRENGKEVVIINVGSGYRAHPRTTSESDYQFVIRDENARITPTTYKRVTFSDLATWNSTDTQTGGWKIPLAKGEKILSASVTYKGTTFFTTYTPNDATLSCSANTGQGKLYSFNIYQKDVGVTAAADCCGEGIPSEPSVPIFSPKASTDVTDQDPTGAGTPDSCSNASATVMVGTRAIKGSFNQCNALDKTYWKEN